MALHLGATVMLVAYGVHRLMLALRLLKRGAAPSRRIDLPADPPRVTIQIPLYNERYVAERVIHAAGAIDYPRDRFDVQVLDDSTDDTTRLAARAVDELTRRGVRAAHIRRPHRNGFKAGALANGLRSASGDLIAIFDADFVPPADFLRRMVGEFGDPGVGMVQARWGHLNRSTNLLTRVQALQLDAHFTVEHGVRFAHGCFFNFNGTAGVWRRQAIEDAGGWQPDTLTEDLDLSYRAQLAGWRFVYRDDVEVPAELPVELAAYRMQQQRWAQGGVQSARKLLPRLLHARLPGFVKREALWHLTANASYPILVALVLSSVSTGWLVDNSYRMWLFALDGLLLTFATLALTGFYGTAAFVRDGRVRPRIALVPAIMVLGAGIALSQSVSVWRGFSSRPWVFRRTPKYRVESSADRRWSSAGYRLVAARPAVVELGLGLVISALAAAAVVGSGALPSGPVLIVGLGFVTVGAGGLLQGRRGTRDHTG